jgi:hypothetical protein
MACIRGGSKNPASCIWFLASGGVGERRIRGEVRAEALVDFIRVRMPE